MQEVWLRPTARSVGTMLWPDVLGADAHAGAPRGAEKGLAQGPSPTSNSK
jgi:hypothetical protein